MSGHSKWSSIKHKKGAADAKRANIFTKIANLITVAAKDGGGDINMNFKLKLAVEKAKQANMPKDNIERAIKKGTGELEGKNIEEIIYEGFGPLGIPIIIETLTDNRNRTAASIKHILSKYGGSLGSPNSVLWMFEKKGIIKTALPKDPSTIEELELNFIEFGAEEIQKEDDYFIIYTKLENFQKIKENIEKINSQIISSDLEFIPKETTSTLDENALEKLKKLLSDLEENDDVNNYYTNI